MNAATARTSAPLPVWSGRSKQRNWLLVGLILSLAAAWAALLFLLSHGLSTGRAARAGKTPAADLQGEERRSRAPTARPGGGERRLPRRPNRIRTRPTCSCRTTRSRSTSFCRKCTRPRRMPDDTSDVLPDKPKVEQTNLNSVINEIERTTAQIARENPERDTRASSSQ